MKIVLFDMDGTLTPARGLMHWSMVDSLYDLQKSGYEIGIVSGSDLDYIKQQCAPLFDLTLVNCNKIHWLPCNGTKYYEYTQASKKSRYEFKKIYENNMRAHLGETKWRSLIQLLINLQNTMTRVHKNIPLSGTFIDYRGSTINWCPIGRSASTPDREVWEELNINNNIRKLWLDLAQHGLKSAGLFEEIAIKYGGDTSFDIYPVGWDKTYAFNNFEKYKEVYFVGDRCNPTGNDYEAYLLAGEKGFKTRDPSQTINIINEIIATGITSNDQG